MTTHTATSSPLRSAGGFTLIEVVITMVVLAILAAVAIPSYNDSVRKSRRAEAFTAMAAIQQAQERWRANNAAYTTSLAAPDDDEDPGLGMSSTTPNNYYDLSIPSADGTGYVVTAVAKTGTSQAQDTVCRRLSLRMQGGNIRYAGCADCETFTYSEAHACWAR